MLGYLPACWQPRGVVCGVRNLFAKSPAAPVPVVRRAPFSTGAQTKSNTMGTYYTHAGPGHQDDFLAACILLARGHTVVRSNEPVPGAIAFAVGGGPLDQHQNAPGGLCALDLVANHLGVTLVGPWAPVVRALDCGTPDQRNPLVPGAWGSNPIIRFVLDQWSSASTVSLRQHDPLIVSMLAIGHSIATAGDVAAKGLATVSSRVTVRTPRIDGFTHTALDKRGLSYADTALVPDDRWRVASGREPGTIAVLAPRGVRITDAPGASFVHGAGFMAVFPG